MTEPVFELDARDCRVVQETFERNEQTMIGLSVEFDGEDYRPIETWDELLDLAWDLYRQLYDEPRSVGYFTLSHLVEADGGTHTNVVDVLASAVDEACRHDREGDDAWGEDEFKQTWSSRHGPDEELLAG